MLIAAVHVIHDPDEFWSTADEHIAKSPEGIRLVQIARSPDRRQATCLWYAPTVDELHDWIYGLLGHTSDSEYFEVDEANGVGLPGA